MTEIERKALELVNEVETERGMSEWTDVCRSELTMGEALCRAIEQHEAFRQEVSDALIKQGFMNASTGIGRFIIPAPKPDPLVEAMIECGFGDSSNAADDIRAALAKRGLEIREHLK